MLEVHSFSQTTRAARFSSRSAAREGGGWILEVQEKRASLGHHLHRRRARKCSLVLLSTVWAHGYSEDRRVKPTISNAMPGTIGRNTPAIPAKTEVQPATRSMIRLSLRLTRCTRRSFAPATNSVQVRSSVGLQPIGRAFNFQSY